MDFSLFAHMERLTPEQSHEQLNIEFIELCKMADEAKMRAVWTGEHHGMDFTITPNPLLSLVNLANHTSHVNRGTGTVIAPFWHPIKLAGEAASADLITNGRIELGIDLFIVRLLRWDGFYLILEEETGLRTEL